VIYEIIVRGQNGIRKAQQGTPISIQWLSEVKIQVFICALAQICFHSQLSFGTGNYLLPGCVYGATYAARKCE